jgi:hypothetical protein
VLVKRLQRADVLALRNDDLRQGYPITLPERPMVTRPTPSTRGGRLKRPKEVILTRCGVFSGFLALGKL